MASVAPQDCSEGEFDEAPLSLAVIASSECAAAALGRPGQIDALGEAP